MKIGIGIGLAFKQNGSNAVAPTNTVAPVISGTTTLGSTLSCTTGTWTGTAPITYAYQWKRNGSNIGGATNSTYVTVVADSTANITCVVTATNTAGSGTATSNTLTMANYTPVNSVAPAVTGTAVVGQTLTTTNGTWTNSPSTYTYQWYRGATLITGATNSTYTLAQADAGNASNIKCTVTASNGLSASADSNTVVIVYDATADAYITAASITNSTQKQAANFEMYTLKAGGITSGYVAEYPILGGAATPHSYNMFNTAIKQLTYAGTITHGSNGMQGNAASGVANTNINPSTDLNGDFAIWFYSRTATTSGTWADLGVIAGGANPGIYMGLQTNTVNGFSANCDINTALAAIANTSGFFLMKRVGNTVTIKRNDVTIHTFTAPNTSYQNGLIRLMASMVLPSSTVNYSGKQYTDFGFVKNTFTAGMDTAAYNAVLGKETILGRA